MTHWKTFRPESQEDHLRRHGELVDALDAGPEGGPRAGPRPRVARCSSASRRLQGEPSQAERVEDDRNRAEAHRRARNDRTQQEAEDRVEHARGDRHAERVVDEGEDMVTPSITLRALHTPTSPINPSLTPV